MEKKMRPVDGHEATWQQRKEENRQKRQKLQLKKEHAMNLVVGLPPMGMSSLCVGRCYYGS
jgi:hypothetical protein